MICGHLTREDPSCTHLQLSGLSHYPGSTVPFWFESKLPPKSPSSSPVSTWSLLWMRSSTTVSQRGSHSPCPGCDNHQPLLKYPRWLQLFSKKGRGRRPTLQEGDEQGWEDSKEKDLANCSA